MQLGEISALRIKALYWGLLFPLRGVVPGDVPLGEVPDKSHAPSPERERYYRCCCSGQRGWAVMGWTTLLSNS